MRFGPRAVSAAVRIVPPGALAVRALVTTVPPGAVAVSAMVLTARTGFGTAGPGTPATAIVSLRVLTVADRNVRGAIADNPCVVIVPPGASADSPRVTTTPPGAAADSGRVRIVTTTGSNGMASRPTESTPCAAHNP
jgi:hypothetical protein